MLYAMSTSKASDTHAGMQQLQIWLCHAFRSENISLGSQAMVANNKLVEIALLHSPWCKVQLQATTGETVCARTVSGHHVKQSRILIISPADHMHTGSGMGAGWYTKFEY